MALPELILHAIDVALEDYIGHAEHLSELFKADGITDCFITEKVADLQEEQKSLRCCLASMRAIYEETLSSASGWLTFAGVDKGRRAPDWVAKFAFQRPTDEQVAAALDCETYTPLLHGHTRECLTLVINMIELAELLAITIPFKTSKRAYALSNRQYREVYLHFYACRALGDMEKGVSPVSKYLDRRDTREHDLKHRWCLPCCYEPNSDFFKYTSFPTQYAKGGKPLPDVEIHCTAMYQAKHAGDFLGVLYSPESMVTMSGKSPRKRAAYSPLGVITATPTADD